ncbi:zinc finger protein 528-like isoform X2 [Periplaneta americana]|uniref:zinc finger protein 528-like isoform X2 n=1 Tax=Periplaneta americana TaxID=6978 RepID=UPI0037E6FC25
MSEESSMDGSEWHNEDDAGSWDSEDDLAILTSQLCRICAEESEDLIQCFGERGKEIQLVDKIHTHLPIMVTEDDLLPISVCTSCVKKLEVCHELVNNCLEADARLRTILGFDTVPNDEEQYGFSRNESPNSVDYSEKIEQLQDDELLETDIKKPEEKERQDTEKKHESIAKSNEIQLTDSKPEVKAGYKVILLKMKKSNTLSPDIQIEKALKFLKAGGKTYKVLNTNQKSLIFKNSEKDNVPDTELVKTQPPQAVDSDVKEDVTVKEESEELKSVWDDTKYECIYCDETVTGKHEFVLHQSSEHNNEVFSCEDCELVYELKEDFLEHVKSHQEEKTKLTVMRQYPSPAELAGNKRKLSSDLDVKAPKKIKISENGNSNENTNILKRNKSNVEEEQKFWKCKVWQCKWCGHMATTKQGWREHACERLQDLQCDACGEQFDMEDELIEHQCTHLKEEQEESSFSHQTNLAVQFKRHKTEHGFTCRICLETFSNRGDLLNHRKNHTREELLGVKLSPNIKQDEEEEDDDDDYETKGDLETSGSTHYKCPICYRALPSQQRLESHVAMHTDNSFPCHICGKVLSKKNTLEYHLRTHTGEKPYTCSMCPGAFQSRVGLIVHERIHTGEKPYQCDQCDMAFRCRATLNQHKVVHSDERPFRCIHCGRGFRRRDTLDTHIRTHTDERPYACSICGRAFRQKGDCSKHEKTHDKHAKSVVLLTEGDSSPVYNCPLCVQIFELKEDLDHHFENDHTPEEKASSIVIINSENVITIPGITTVGQGNQNLVLHELS